APVGTRPVGGTPAEVADAVAAIKASTDRAGAAVRLADAVTAWGRKPPDATAPRLKAFQDARNVVTDAYRSESDPATKTALALALSCVHRELHALFKPDELARSAATKAYREAHPAANAAAEAIVHYPTDRFEKK